MHHWASGLALINETRQHESCNLTLIFCARAVPSRSTLQRSSTTLITFSFNQQFWRERATDVQADRVTFAFNLFRYLQGLLSIYIESKLVCIHQSTFKYVSFEYFASLHQYMIIQTTCVSIWSMLSTCT